MARQDACLLWSNKLWGVYVTTANCGVSHCTGISLISVGNFSYLMSAW